MADSWEVLAHDYFGVPPGPEEVEWLRARVEAILREDLRAKEPLPGQVFGASLAISQEQMLAEPAAFAGLLDAKLNLLRDRIEDERHRLLASPRRKGG